MMNKFNKIEEKINALLIKLGIIFMSVLRKVFPPSLFKFFNRVNLKLQTITNKISRAISSKLLVLNSFMMRVFNKLKMVTANSKSKFSKVKSQINHLKKKRVLSENGVIKALLNKITKLMQPLFDKMYQLLARITSSQVFIAGTAITLIISGFTGIYLSSQEIYEQENPNRAPASVEEFDYKPDYKGYQKRSVKFLNLRVPITVESVGEIRSVTIDFVVRTTTKFSKIYLEQYSYKLEDYFFTSVEPVISDFPIKEEGKDVLKEKIIEEVNRFLREHRVEGEVEDVRVTFIVAS